MEKTVLKATPRDGKPRKLRRDGFTPGVLNSSDTSSTPVQFETSALNKLIERHGPNAKVWIELDPSCTLSLDLWRSLPLGLSTHSLGLKTLP